MFKNCSRIPTRICDTHLVFFRNECNSEDISVVSGDLQWVPFSLWSLDFPLPLHLKRKASTSMGTGFTVMTFAPGDLGHFQPQLLVGVQTRGVQHRVPAQGASCNPLVRIAAITKTGMAKLVGFSKLRMSRSHDSMSFWASPLNLPFKMPNNMLVKRLLDFGPHCSWRPRHAAKPSPSPAACTLSQRPVLRQERQHVIELDAEGLLGGDSAAVAAALAATVAMFAAVPIDAAATQAAVVCCCCCCCCLLLLLLQHLLSLLQLLLLQPMALQQPMLLMQ